MSAALVGREEELQRLELFLATAARGPRALLIEGPAGAGKTSVWQAGLEAARATGRRVLAARPTQAEASFAYAGLGDLLRNESAALADLTAPLRRALQVALLLAPDTVDAADAADQQAVALAVLAVLSRLADDGPLVVAVDDVQWLDPPSALVLGYAARRLERAPVALLASWRTDTGSPVPLGLDRPPAAERLERLALPPLSLGAVQRLLKDRLGPLPPRPALLRLHELAGGNPFFALELGRAVQAGTLRLEPGERLPVALDGLVRSRLGAFPRPTRRALAAAAALAQPTLALVGAITGCSPDALDEAEAAGVIELRDGRIAFTHPLLASGAYGAVDASERRALHARAGTEVTDPEERARHLALASEGPDESVAAALEQAARRAEMRGAPPAAAELFERSVRLTPPEARANALRRTIDGAFCTFQAGDGRRARELLDDVVAELSPGPERARALLGLARVRSYDDDLRAAEALFRQALDEAGADDELRAAGAQYVSSILFRLRERLEEAVGLADDAVRAARSANSTGWLAESLAARALSEAALGRVRDAEPTLEAALELQELCSERRVMAQPLFAVAVVWLWWDRLGHAKEAYERLLERAREMGDESSLPYILVMCAQVECVRGDFALAAARADEGLELTEQTGQETLGAYLLAVRALAAAGAGDEEIARDRAMRALETAERTSGRPAEQFALAALGALELSLGRAAETASTLGPLVDFLRREGIREPGAQRVVPDQVEALIALRELDAAEELTVWFERNAVELGRVSAQSAAARCRGLLLAERGDLAGALERLDEAVRLAAGAPVPMEHGRALLVRGTLGRRARQKRAARESLEAARAVFERMGARVWAERAEAELARVSGRQRSSDTLTPTESRVAQLVAEGMQTKQVAAALFVSSKTVEGHLTSIYAKLGVHSRTELAHRLAQRSTAR